MSDQLLTEDDVAAIFNVSPHTVRKWRQRGVIVCIKIGQTVRYEQDEVDRVMSEARQAV